MTSSAFRIASCSACLHLTTEVGKWKDGRTGKRRNETGHVSVTVNIMTIIIIITITIIIRHELSVDRPVWASSNSLFKDLPSRLRSFGPHFSIIFGILL